MGHQGRQNCDNLKWLYMVAFVKKTKTKTQFQEPLQDPSLQLTQSICIKPSYATLSMLPHNYLHGVCQFIGLPWWRSGKESACNAGDLGTIPGLGRSPGEGNGYLLHYCDLENSMDCIVHRRRQWHPTPVLLPGKSHGRRSWVGCSPWDH